MDGRATKKLPRPWAEGHRATIGRVVFVTWECRLGKVKNEGCCNEVCKDQDRRHTEEQAFV